MALSQSGLNELLEAIRAGDGTDTLREAMRVGALDFGAHQAHRGLSSHTAARWGSPSMRPAAVGSAIDAPTLPLAVPDPAMAEVSASSWANTALEHAGAHTQAGGACRSLIPQPR